MDCDTTGIEPDIALVKYKLLAGEGNGMLKIVNRTVPEGLRRLGYSPEDTASIVAHIGKFDTIEDVTRMARPSPAASRLVTCRFLIAPSKPTVASAASPPWPIFA